MNAGICSASTGTALKSRACHHRRGVVGWHQDRAVASADNVATFHSTHLTDQKHGVWSLDVGDKRSVEGFNHAYCGQDRIKVAVDEFRPCAQKLGWRRRNRAPSERRCWDDFGKSHRERRVAQIRDQG